MPTTLEHSAPSVPQAPSDVATKFHLSLNVANLDSAIGFYRVLMGVAPAKCYPDYAKFEMSDPPVVLSLEPQRHAAGGALNHLGFRVPTSAALVDMQHRLEAAGIATHREEGVECCYARQTKFWVKDPDQNLWEVYVLEADTDHRGQGSAVAPVGKGDAHPPAAEANAPDSSSPETTWEHHLGHAFPAAIPLQDGSADRVYLRGTFNAVLTADEQAKILEESRRVLRPGGRVVIHGLAADAPLTGPAPQLPGPAAGVRRAPAPDALIDALRAANFTAIRLLKLSATSVFRHEGIGLREILIEGVKLDSTPFDLRQVVQYQGPFREVTDDFGNLFPRGQRKSIATPAVEALRGGPTADSFLFFPPGGES
ncbi:MAG TPA: ArsI/CadI family heavy metal resistance metalloenzyme [Tepidisphaeraceae bacterium]|jgi:SAM-dependent methyltransferase|nr:ArsI/CadI family heavy metal resistance metalloenzyme [Tepidisphaeraceae bacterium]